MKTDRELQQDVIAELSWDAAVDASRVGVEVKDGIVTLSGHVDSYSQKWNAERVPMRVAGVKGVAVELDVVLPGTSLRNDSQIAAAAIGALDWNVSIPKDAVKVMVEQGWVTLTGKVEWSFTRQAAEACVRDLLGVRGVINRIQIRPRTTPHDVKGKIEAALQRRAHLDAEGIGVRVENGTVTLTGAVDSLAERDLVEAAAWNAPGVHQVVDQISILPQ